MIENLPNWIELLFVLTVILTVIFFYYSNGRPKKLTLVIILWSVMQSVLAYIGFYQVSDTVVPRFGLVLIPPVMLMIYGLLPKQKKWFFERRDTRLSTFLHSVRLPVEIVLFGLFTYRMIPELMTFEGRNFDILIGISAPIIGWLFMQQKINNRLLLIWNAVGLFFVIFIFFNGILSSELPFQQFGFQQPNKAVNYFPFVLLPATIVPIVIWTHLTDLLKLRREITTAE